MNQDPQMPPQQGEAPQAPNEQGGPLTQMVIQTDQALTSLAQVMGKSNPEVGQALAQLSEQYREIIMAVLNQGEAPRMPSQMVDEQARGQNVQPAY